MIVSYRDKRTRELAAGKRVQWRICFEWPEGAAGPCNVEIADYH